MTQFELAVQLAEEHLPGLSVAVTDRVFRFAWEEGHASGAGEVGYWYGEVAEIVKAALKEGSEHGVGR